MTQAHNQPDNESEGLTREFNFPKPWIKDYNPQIHGIKPGMDFQQSTQPPITGPQPYVQSEARPGQSPQYPAPSQTPPPAYVQSNMPPPKEWQTGPVQWNPDGVYGGGAVKQKGIPTWAWTLISAVILILVLLLLYFVVLR